MHHIHRYICNLLFSQQIISDDPSGNHILINSGNAYQKVTVVPTDTNSGELSYVLIVQNPDDIKDGDQTDGDQDLTGKNSCMIMTILMCLFPFYLSFWLATLR